MFEVTTKGEKRLLDGKLRDTHYSAWLDSTTTIVITINAIPHCSTDGNWYEGMFIPNETMCLVNLNLKICNHNPAIYSDNAMPLFNVPFRSSQLIPSSSMDE